jgi:hypothetical protein
MNASQLESFIAEKIKLALERYKYRRTGDLPR